MSDPTPQSQAAQELQRPGHSVRDLEVHLNKSLVETCKIDACVDEFLVQLHRIYPLDHNLSNLEEVLEKKDEKDEGPGRDESSQGGLGGTNNPEFETVKQQLTANLGRLAPGFLHANSENGFIDLNRILPKMRTRWNMRRFQLDKRPLDSFRRSLLETLAEVNYRELQAHLKPQSEQQGAPSLKESTFWESCRQLQQTIEGERSSASFSCGGSIDIAESEPQNGTPIKRVSLPISIFWATQRDSHARKVVLPLSSWPDSSQHVLQQLVDDCSPATFGRAQQDVLDPSYRRAGKIDPAHFATTFDLAKFGILESIEQILLPSINNQKESDLQFRKLSAELYKLNVYSGPSGLFRKHVDTPRSANQIGSLVVCLPSQFEGGNLIVRHHGQEIDFDWSASSVSTIQWAAFYSDCEHEIKTITNGNRITLTYNLYVTEPLGSTLLPNPIVDPETLPLYGYLKDLMEHPGFMGDGGVLGIFCSHAYAHTTKTGIKGFPRRLKGSDLVLYSVFKSLGIETEILPVVENEGRFIKEDPRLHKLTQDSSRYYDPSDYEMLRGSYTTSGQHQRVPISIVIEKYLAGEEGYDADIDEYHADSFHNYDDVDIRWKVLIMQRRIKGLENLVGEAKSNGLDTTGLSYVWEGARIGKSLHPYTSNDDHVEDGDDEELISRKIWPFSRLPGITWLTVPKHKELAFTYIAHGNQASIGTHYSCAAIIAVIPPYHARGKLGGATKMELDSLSSSMYKLVYKTRLESGFIGSSVSDIIKFIQGLPDDGAFVALDERSARDETVAVHSLVHPMPNDV